MNIDEHLAKGYRHFDNWEMEEALREFTRVIDLSPDLAEAFTARGYTYQRIGHSEPAITDFMRAIELDPSDAYARKGQGDAQSMVGRMELAIANYDHAIQLLPGDADFYLCRGRAFNSVGKTQQAISDFRQALALGSENWLTHYCLALNLHRQRNCSEAAHHYHRAVVGEEASTNEEVLTNYIWLLATSHDLNARDPAEAIRLGKYLGDIECEESQPLAAVATAYAANSKFETAVATQQKVVELIKSEMQEGLMDDYYQNQLPIEESRITIYQSRQCYTTLQGPWA